MIGIWPAMLSKGNKVGAIIMDLSKAFVTLSHNFLSCKLKASSFNKNVLSFIQRYFTNRHQRAKLGDKFSKWQKISTDVLQGSILDPLFFNIFINDLFLFNKAATICNFADENSNIVINRLKHDFAIISECFY